MKAFLGHTIALVLSAAAVLGLLALIQPSAHIFGIYFTAAFWVLVGADFLVSEVQEKKGRFSFVDRFLAYLFVAWLIWPVRLVQLVRAARASGSGSDS